MIDVKVGVQKRYGYQILKLAHGAWFWSPPLQAIDYVPVGKHTSTDGRSLRINQNTLEGATRAALKVELTRDWGAS